ncbi:MAG: hypothetical protein IIY58_04995, partial [Aeriscardovia sp.]|nr:hypothetical protein [Aeriscardovia sp.]
KYGMQDGIAIMVDLITELQQKEEKEERTERVDKREKREESPSVVPDVPLTTPGYPYPYVNPIWGGSGTGEQPTWDWGKVTCGPDAPKAYYGNRSDGGANIASTSAETATSSQTKMVKIMDSAGVVFEVPESSFGVYAENLKAQDARDERAQSDGRGPKKSPKKD